MQWCINMLSAVEQTSSWLGIWAHISKLPKIFQIQKVRQPTYQSTIFMKISRVQIVMPNSLKIMLTGAYLGVPCAWPPLNLKKTFLHKKSKINHNRKGADLPFVIDTPGLPFHISKYAPNMLTLIHIFDETEYNILGIAEYSDICLHPCKSNTAKSFF